MGKGRTFPTLFKKQKRLLGSGRWQRHHPATIPGKKEVLALLAQCWSSKRSSAGHPVPGGWPYRWIYSPCKYLSLFSFFFFLLTVLLPFEMMIFRFWFCRHWLLSKALDAFPNSSFKPVGIYKSPTSFVSNIWKISTEAVRFGSPATPQPIYPMCLFPKVTSALLKPWILPLRVTAKPTNVYCRDLSACR